MSRQGSIRPGRPATAAATTFTIVAAFVLGASTPRGVAAVPAGGDAVSRTAPCAAVARMAGAASDAGPALQACVDAAPRGSQVTLPPGRYVIATPVVIRHPLILATRGVGPDTPPCASDERRCAALHLTIKDAAVGTAVMPFGIESGGVRLDHLVFVGTRRSDPGLSARRCASDAHRPMAGGVRVNGNGVKIRKSVFRDMACYTALEYGTGADAEIADNDFTGNGIHTTLLRWADGLTIHDATRFVVTGNRFRENTDVQLILGSCVACTIADNRFRHGRSAAGGAFAEIMLQAWPSATSGDFTNTRTIRNDIDCGAALGCGFGIMIGSAPWYDAPAFGGTVTDNSVRGAMLALDVDHLTGPMVIGRNQLAESHGTYPSNCGLRRVDAAANVSSASRRFLSPSFPSSAGSYARCILNYVVGPDLPGARYRRR